MKRLLNFEVDDEIISQLKLIADKNERSLSAQLRFIILSYLKENEDGKGTNNSNTQK